MSSKYVVAYTDHDGKLNLGIVNADDSFNAAIMILEDEFEGEWNTEINNLSELIDFVEAFGFQLLIEEVN